jgi:hypothetical protein
MKKEADIYINLHCKFVYDDEGDEDAAIREYSNVMSDLADDVRCLTSEYRNVRLVDVEASG